MSRSRRTLTLGLLVCITAVAFEGMAVVTAMPAAAVASCCETPPPTFPVRSSRPDRNGNCPEVHTWSPTRAAARYAATGADTGGSSRPSSASGEAGPVTSTPHTYVVAGSSGFIGSALVAALQADGHRVVRLVRRPPEHEDELLWNPSLGATGASRDLRDALEGVHAVVNLAGAGIAWTNFLLTVGDHI